MGLSKMFFRMAKNVVRSAQKEQQRRAKQGMAYEAQKRRAIELMEVGNTMKSAKSRITRYRRAKEVLMNALEIYPDAKDADDVRGQIRAIDEILGET